MQITRTVAHVEAATKAVVGVHKVNRALPVRHLKQISPFIFIDHMEPFEIKKGEKIMRIDPHPHAGFEVVTYLLNGKFFHRDSQGNEQIAEAGDINWMTSGKGIIHSEGPINEMAETGGTVSLMQTWINLPANKKFIDPSFRHYAGSNLPLVSTDAAELKVLIGSYGAVTSPITTHTAMYYYHIKMKAGQVFSYAVDAKHTAGIYVIDGSLKILNHTTDKGTVVEFNNDGDAVAVKSLTDVEFIAFGGEPINEPLVSYGPFVMNDFKEIQQAIHDYESGKMGVLEY